MRRRPILQAAAAAAAAAVPWAHLAAAQGVPVRLVVPFAPGGGADTAARIVRAPFAMALGRPVQVENRPGAGGSVGMAEVARAPADGSVLGFATVSTHGVNAAVHQQLPYRAQEDFDAVVEIVRAPGLLAVDARLGIDRLEALRIQLKQARTPLVYATPGHGTVGHMWGELFKNTTNTRLVHQPHGGDGVAGTLSRGGVDLFFDQVAPLLPHIRQGRLRALAVSWPQRLAMLPDVPTYAELALFSNNDPSWFGLVVPRGTPLATVRQIHLAMQSALARPEVAALLGQQGLFPSGAGPREFTATVVRELDKMRRINRFAKISVAT